MSNYHVAILQPANYRHSHAFLEVGQLLVHSLRGLGLTADLAFGGCAPGAVNIVLGYNLLAAGVIPPKPFVIYQLEQLSRREGWFEPWHTDLFAQAEEVWDYSVENLAFLSRLPGIRARHVPLGHHPALETIAPRIEDIDVLFYGSLNDRRRRVLDAIAQFARVEYLYEVYGAERDAFIQRSRIVLNVHYYDAQILEQVRIFHLLTNRRFVVSEDSAENPFDGGIVTGPIERLPEICRGYLGSFADRQAIAARGYEQMRQRPMTEILRPAVSASPLPSGARGGGGPTFLRSGDAPR